MKNLTPGRRELYAYFTTQVLDRLPDDHRRFLLHASQVDPIEPGICRALTGVQDPQAMLRSLEERGLFLTRLDAAEEHYRSVRGLH